MPLEPCEVHDTFEGIFDPNAVIVRVVDHHTSPWHDVVNKMVLVATGDGRIQLCDEAGNAERDFNVSDLSGVIEQQGEVKIGMQKAMKSQLLFKVNPPAPDLLVHLIKDKRNKGSDVDDFYKTLQEVVGKTPFERRSNQGVIGVDEVRYDAKPEAESDKKSVASKPKPSPQPTPTPQPQTPVSVAPAPAPSAQPTPVPSAVPSAVSAPKAPPSVAKSDKSSIVVSEPRSQGSRASLRDAPPPTPPRGSPAVSKAPSVASAQSIRSVKEPTPQASAPPSRRSSVGGSAPQQQPTSADDNERTLVSDYSRYLQVSRTRKPLKDTVLEALWAHRTQAGLPPCPEEQALLKGLRPQHTDGVTANRITGIVSYGAVKRSITTDEAFAAEAIAALAAHPFASQQILAGSAVGVLVSTLASKCFLSFKFNEVYHEPPVEAHPAHHKRRRGKSKEGRGSGAGGEADALKRRIAAVGKRIASTEGQLRSANQAFGGSAVVERQLAGELEGLTRELQEQERQMAKMDETISVLTQRQENQRGQGADRQLGDSVPDVTTLAKLREDIVRSNESVLAKDAEIAELQRQLDGSREAILAAAHRCFEKDVKLHVTKRSLKKFSDSASPRREEASPVPVASPLPATSPVAAHSPHSPEPVAMHAPRQHHHVAASQPRNSHSPRTHAAAPAMATAHVIESPRVSPPRQRWHLE